MSDSSRISEKLAKQTKLTLEQLKRIKISNGNHEERDDGVCIMEAVAWFAGKPHSERPSCVDSEIASLLIIVNDDVSDADRQRLKALVPAVVETTGLYPQISKSLRKHILASAAEKIENNQTCYVPDWIGDTAPNGADIGLHLVSTDGLKATIAVLIEACEAAKAKKKAKKSRKNTAVRRPATGASRHPSLRRP